MANRRTLERIATMLCCELDQLALAYLHTASGKEHVLPVVRAHHQSAAFTLLGVLEHLTDTTGRLRTVVRMRVESETKLAVEDVMALIREDKANTKPYADAQRAREIVLRTMSQMDLPFDAQRELRAVA